MSWTPPAFSFSSSTPSQCLSLELHSDKEYPTNFARSAKWSPDGLSVLAHSENRTFQVFDMCVCTISSLFVESCVYSPDSAHLHETLPPGQSNAHLVSTLLHQPSPIIDYLWYPTATRHDPASYCFLASVRECPVKLLDASTGRLRASYKIVDHRERQVAPHCMAFNLTASRLYCGFEDAIEVFDINRPGEGTRMHTTPSKKSKDGLKGIISALAFSPGASYPDTYYAAGSLTPVSHNIVLYSESQGDAPVMFIGGGVGRNSPSYGGVVQLRFNPLKPHILYASFRSRHAHGHIYAWDLRMSDSGESNPPYQVFQTSSGPSQQKASIQAKETNYNQKLFFDVDVTGKWLSVGDQFGQISVFDLDSDLDASSQGDSMGSIQQQLPEQDVLHPSCRFEAHIDAVSSTCLNPCFPLLLSTSGSRRFVEDLGDVGDEVRHRNDANEHEVVNVGLEEHDADSLVGDLRPITLDSSVKVWWSG
ncbi:hypothetical protein AMATHDRAFT_163735 [Amanita thiersii Skay4041]|uniref:DUF2415 domain-containing protein n=1 Tax=Amanita thiersii Skay4041 TaxID=703135 RepID=A0A2A9N9W4_9AGAR|nr:hypothetical protein AMATHDRAFT_163735 [Amanita thiersii Skay4041]